MHHPLRRLSAPALAATLLLAACGSDGDSATGAEDTTATTTAATATSPTTATAGPAGGPASTTTAGSAATPTTGAPTTAAPNEQRVEFVFANGAVVGGAKTTKLAAGKPVVLVIRSDVAEEVHLHGYDLEVDVEPGQPAELRFAADIPGVFELEFHGSGRKLGELEIR